MAACNVIELCVVVVALGALLARHYHRYTAGHKITIRRARKCRHENTMHYETYIEKFS